MRVSFNDGSIIFNDDEFIKTSFVMRHYKSIVERTKEITLGLSPHQETFFKILQILLDNRNNLKNITIQDSDYTFKAWAEDSKNLSIEINNMFNDNYQTAVTIRCDEFVFTENSDINVGILPCSFYDVSFTAGYNSDGAFLKIPTKGENITLIFSNPSNLNDIFQYMAKRDIPDTLQRIGYLDNEGKNMTWITNSRLMLIKFMFNKKYLLVHLDHTYSPKIRREE